MGINMRKNGENNWNEEDKKLKLIERPEGCPNVYLKVAVGKFCRLLLTTSN